VGHTWVMLSNMYYRFGETFELFVMQRGAPCLSSRSLDVELPYRQHSMFMDQHDCSWYGQIENPQGTHKVNIH
jgi:hypothetical protein